MSKELGNTPADKNYQPSGISKAEQAAWKAYPYEGGTKGLICEIDRSIFIRGYEQAEKDTIERAVAWLKENWRDYVWTDFDGVIHFGSWEDDFRKAMEEE